MSWKLRALISAMLLAPTAAFGLGLGEIRLNSGLNEPLSAEIDLVAATPEELAALQASLASTEIFQRYGLDRPAYLSTIEFNVGRGQDGRSVLLVRSRDAISEPFVSFLVDVNWARGRLLREYTVLLDPPVLAAPSAARAAEPIAAPTTMPSRPQPAPAQQAPATAPATDPADSTASDGAGTRRVERGDTLYEIASTLSGGDRQATQRLMMGLYRANPEAFNGNINQLRAGAILRVPDATEYADIAASDAAAEVSRQAAAWRAAGGGASSGQLRLVTPEEGVADVGSGETDSSGKVQSQIESLERDIQEQQRLLELRNQELAQLQRTLADRRAAEQAAADKAAADKAAADKAAADKAAADQAAVPPTDEAAVAPEDEVVPEKPAVTPPKPAAKPAAKAPPAADEKSFFESLTDNWMFLLGAAGLLLIGILGFGYVRRRREEDVNVALKSFDLRETAPVPTETMRLRALATGDETAEIERPTTFEEQDRNFVVEERPIARPKPEPSRPTGFGHEETISTEAALDLDQADPLAEADFHMAYGLYDQAVDLVRRALQQSPDRNDLKLKLAEIHFVAGDTAQFLSVARDLRKTLGPGGDWDRIVIMGRQLAPDEAMFAGGVQDAGVDLSLEGGDNLVDLDLLSAPDGDEGLDLDLGRTAVLDSDDVTGENTSVEFNLDEGTSSRTATQEIVRRDGPGTIEMPTLELPASETPTVETPAVKLKNRGNAQPVVPTDATAEMAIDDLGLDLDMGDLPDGDDATALAPGLGDESTQVSRRDDSTQLAPFGNDEDEGTALLPIGETSTTSMMPKLELDAIDLDIGGAMDDGDAAPTARDRLGTEQMPQLSELEPVTMSEVGTKLDLARAYMDMGDPDGARNILQEVLAEGSASQKQEARRLIDSLPGA